MDQSLADSISVDGNRKSVGVEAFGLMSLVDRLELGYRWMIEIHLFEMF